MGTRRRSSKGEQPIRNRQAGRSSRPGGSTILDVRVWPTPAPVKIEINGASANAGPWRLPVHACPICGKTRLGGQLGSRAYRLELRYPWRFCNRASCLVIFVPDVDEQRRLTDAEETRHGIRIGFWWGHTIEPIKDVERRLLAAQEERIAALSPRRAEGATT